MTEGEALAWLARLFDEPVEKVKTDTARDSIVGWDSLGMLTLMADLDEKFDVQVGEQDVSGMTAVADVLNLLKKHGKVTAA